MPCSSRQTQKKLAHELRYAAERRFQLALFRYMLRVLQPSTGRFRIYGHYDRFQFQYNYSSAGSRLRPEYAYPSHNQR
jgi:hypothetical protein